MIDLAQRKCKPCEGGMPPFTNAKADSLMQQLDGWQRYDHLINKTYHFKDYYQTIAFVNAVAGDLSGQRKVKAVMLPAGQQTIGGEQCRLDGGRVVAVHGGVIVAGLLGVRQMFAPKTTRVGS